MLRYFLFTNEYLLIIVITKLHKDKLIEKQNENKVSANWSSISVWTITKVMSFCCVHLERWRIENWIWNQMLLLALWNCHNPIKLHTCGRETLSGGKMSTNVEVIAKIGWMWTEVTLSCFEITFFLWASSFYKHQNPAAER